MAEFKTIINRITLDPKKRVLAISDIHGNIDLFKQLLNKVNFSNNDYLFIVGDIIEKGPKSLETLRYIMELVKNKNVFVLIGNNDTVVSHIINNNINEDLLKYVLNQNSIYNEMCKELNISLNQNSNLKKINEKLYSSFSKEIDFIMNLPTIIETEDLLFAHAGINDYNNMEKLDFISIVKNDVFINKALVFPKTLIVGHYPTIVYQYQKADCGIYYDQIKNIIAIDGGNVVKRSGQLNCLIITTPHKISYEAVDNLPLLEVIEDQEETPSPYTIAWNREEFSIIDSDEKYYNVYIKRMNKNIKVLKDFIYFQKGKYYFADYTNYFLPLKRNETIKLIKYYDDLVYIKKDSIAGWIKRSKVREKNG